MSVLLFPRIGLQGGFLIEHRALNQGLIVMGRGAHTSRLKATPTPHSTLFGSFQQFRIRGRWERLLAAMASINY